ncbi:MAG: MOSC domain-containing protein [Alphaproteobacteria bacterium]|nr:MOSC domain-containing protein [Alphaproteobacteria bacterium]
MSETVVAVSRNPNHTFSKTNEHSIRLVEGLGVDGDTHSGVTDQHRSHVARNPNAPNLRQVHLIHAELHDELEAKGFSVVPGQMGENITTRGVDLLNLPTGTRLHLGDTALVELTGLRNPCKQLNGIQDGLMQETIEKQADGTIIRKSGVMSIVISGGDVHQGDSIRVELPPQPHKPMEPV